MINAKIKQYYGKILVYKNKAKHKKCFKLERKLLAIIKFGDELYQDVIKSHGETLINLQKYKEAIPYLLLALENKTNPKELYEINHYLFKAYYELSNYQQVIIYGIKLIEYDEIDPFEKATLLSIIGRFNYMMYLARNKMAYLIRGLHYNTESQKLFKELKKTNNMEYLYTLYDCGDINFALEDYDTAITYYEQVEKLTDDSNLLFGIYINLMHIYKNKGYKDTMLLYKSKLKALNLN